MKVRKMFYTLMAIVLMVGLINVNVYAAGITFTIDNDALATSGYTNTGSSEEFEYITGSTLKNGDARIANSRSYYKYFYRHAPVPWTSGSGICSMRAYIYHNNFTDPGATYMVMKDDAFAIIVGTINQATAPGGWNYIGSGTKTSYQKVGFGALIGTSGKGSQYATGADQVEITYN